MNALLDAPLKASRDPTPAQQQPNKNDDNDTAMDDGDGGGRNDNKNGGGGKKKKKRSNRDNNNDNNGRGNNNNNNNGNRSHKKQRSSLENANNKDSCSVFIGNLSFSTSWQDLKDHCRNTNGEVVHADVLRQGNRSKGCGVVQFATPKQAQEAIRALHQTTLDGREIFVQEYNSRERQEDDNDEDDYENPYNNGGRGNNNNANNNNANCTIFVGNLPWQASWQDLKDFVRSECNNNNQQGAAVKIRHADIPNDKQGRSAGYGLVELETPAQAARAVQCLDGAEFKGRTLSAHLDKKSQNASSNNNHNPNNNNSNGNRNNTNNNSSSNANCRVYVGNLKYETTWQMVKDHMRQAGNVDRADLLTHPNGNKGNNNNNNFLAGKSKGCAIVTYTTPREAQRAIKELHDSVLDGRPLLVRADRED